MFKSAATQPVSPDAKKKKEINSSALQLLIQKQVTYLENLENLELKPKDSQVLKF